MTDRVKYPSGANGPTQSDRIDDLQENYRWAGHFLISDIIREFDLSTDRRLSEYLFGSAREALATGLGLAIQEAVDVEEAKWASTATPETKDDPRLWRFWNRKARALAEENEELRAELDKLEG